MKVLALLLWTPVLCMLYSNAFSQHVVNEIESYVSWLNKGTVYEMGAARITDGNSVVPISISYTVTSHRPILQRHRSNYH
ncbi:hypothetical protein FAZ19_06845 [Sphingobacterium alkalisoli]|uniref:Uncharacterized protein n=1 Tax=Sphingobacterium alkalisoli TaxID=1874115 RepID=A0A4U0H8A0_9SPHI|nr:hypothetical protein [Sphingobacterium alkalisoli]TJY66632.1 hypothetical protein FAZ19_06845 [Sphingobacterium alkalisoli]